MVQSKKPKLSSRARKLLQEISVDNFALLKAVFSGHADVAEEALLLATYPERQRLLVDVANLRDEKATLWFWKKWIGWIRPERNRDLIQISDELRTVWRRPESLGSNRVLDKWLFWLPSRLLIEAYEHFHLAKGDATDDPKDYPPFRCSIEAGGLVPDFRSLRAMLIQGVFEHRRQFKYCSNRDCSAPYFIAKRKDQTVCDAEICKAEKQRQHALKWWNENRAKRGQTEAVGKSTKKRSKDNGPDKAR